MEAWKAANYTRTEWDAESPNRQGQIIAHHIHMKLREGYDMEQMMNEGKKSPAGSAHTVADYQSMIAAHMANKR